MTTPPSAISDLNVLAITRTISRLSHHHRVTDIIDIAACHHLPHEILILITEYQLSYDAIAHSLEQQLSLCYPPSSSSLSSGSETKLDVRTICNIIPSYHDPSSLICRLSQLAYDTWVNATKYDEVSTRGRAWYKRSQYMVFGCHACQIESPNEGTSIALKYARLSKSLGYTRAYALLNSLNGILTNGSTILTDDDRTIPDHILDDDTLCWSSQIIRRPSHREYGKAVGLLVEMARDDTTDVLPAYLLAQMESLEGANYWVARLAHRGVVVSCVQMSILHSTKNHFLAAKQSYDEALRWIATAIEAGCRKYPLLTRIVQLFLLHHDNDSSKIWSTLPRYQHASIRKLLSTLELPLT
jgi:hypothetical protein